MVELKEILLIHFKIKLGDESREGKRMILIKVSLKLLIFEVEKNNEYYLRMG